MDVVIPITPTTPYSWHTSIELGNATQVQQILNEGHDINEIDRFKQTGMMRACIFGHIDIVKLLLQYPTIDINLIDYRGYTARDYAYTLGNYNISTLLGQYNVKYHDIKSGTVTNTITSLKRPRSP